MESEQIIRLERSPHNPSQEILVGINGDTAISDRIAHAVEESGRLFPYVVNHIATNRIGDIQVCDDERREIVRSVRDELNMALNGLRRARELTLNERKRQQVLNLTQNVSVLKQPYFAR